METNLFDIFAQFAPTETATKCEPITAGLINHTYAVFVEGEEKPKYVLQKINTNIFKDPDILMNNIVIIIQIVLVALSVIFNFLIDDFAVFITVFIHIAIFVLYNGIVESIVEYGYLRKKFAKICDETYYL